MPRLGATLVRRPPAPFIRLFGLFIFCVIFYATYTRLAVAPPSPEDSLDLNENDVELVVASVRDDNTSWIHDFFSRYPAHVYVMDDARAALTVPQNKGRESMAYLT